MSRYIFFPDRATSAELIAHVRALLSTVRPGHLRKAEVHEALAEFAETLGQNLSAEAVRAVIGAQPAEQLQPVKRRKCP